MSQIIYLFLASLSKALAYWTSFPWICTSHIQYTSRSVMVISLGSRWKVFVLWSQCSTNAVRRGRWFWTWTAITRSFNLDIMRISSSWLNLGHFLTFSNDAVDMAPPLMVILCSCKIKKSKFLLLTMRTQDTWMRKEKWQINSYKNKDNSKNEIPNSLARDKWKVTRYNKQFIGF